MYHLASRVKYQDICPEMTQSPVILTNACTVRATSFLCVPRNAVEIFSLKTLWKSESVSTLDVPFMSTVEHRGRHGGTLW